MKKYIVILLLILPIIAVAQDNKYQVIGLRLGLGGSTLTGIDKRSDILGDKIYSQYRFSFDVGTSLQFGLRNDIFVQTDFYIGMQGANSKSYTGKESDNLAISNLQGIVYVGKKFPLGRNTRALVAAGPYIGYDFLMGDYYEENNEVYDDMGSITKATIDSDDIEMHRYDFGMMMLAGVEIGNVQIALNPQYGLTSIVKGTPRVKHRVLKLGVTFYF